MEATSSEGAGWGAMGVAVAEPDTTTQAGRGDDDSGRLLPRPVPKIVARTIPKPADRPRAILPPLPAALPAPPWTTASGSVSVLTRTTDLSLQAMPQLLEPPAPGPDRWAALRETDWGLVMLLAAGCVTTLLLAMSMWILAIAPPH
jgi:hypothetical protein